MNEQMLRDARDELLELAETTTAGLIHCYYRVVCGGNGPMGPARSKKEKIAAIAAVFQQQCHDGTFRRRTHPARNPKSGRK